MIRWLMNLLFPIQTAALMDDGGTNTHQVIDNPARRRRELYVRLESVVVE